MIDHFLLLVLEALYLILVVWVHEVIYCESIKLCASCPILRSMKLLVVLDNYESVICFTFHADEDKVI